MLKKIVVIIISLIIVTAIVFSRLYLFENELPVYSFSKTHITVLQKSNDKECEEKVYAPKRFESMFTSKAQKEVNKKLFSQLSVIDEEFVQENSEYKTEYRIIKSTHNELIYKMYLKETDKEKIIKVTFNSEGTYIIA